MTYSRTNTFDANILASYLSKFYKLSVLNTCRLILPFT